MTPRQPKPDHKLAKKTTTSAIDPKLVEEAIRKAIKGGAAQARPNPLTPSAADFDRVETDVEIEPQVLEDYIADLKRDQQMARFDSAFVTVPSGYGVGTNLISVARLLLARAIVSGDVSGTVETFRSYVEKNSAPMITVMAVWGAKTTREVRLGPDIRLLPLTSVPPSWLRGQALGHPDAAFTAWNIHKHEIVLGSSEGPVDEDRDRHGLDIRT